MSSELVNDGVTEQAEPDTQAEPPAPWQLKMADWEQMRVITRLLEKGRNDESLLSLARRECRRLEQEHTFQAAAERERCLAELARIRSESGQEEDVTVALQEHREQTRATMFSRDDRVQGFVSLTDGHPERLLQTLEDSLNERVDLVTLYLWEQFTHDWRALLVARVFNRMFDERLIGPVEAQRLCREMLAALRALPVSALQGQWELVYDFLEATLSQKPRPTKNLTVKRTPLGWSHMVASSLLNLTHEKQPNSADFWPWFNTALPPAASFLESRDFKVDKLYVPKDKEHHAIFCFPAIRIASVLVGARHRVMDPVGQRIARRAHIAYELRDNEFLLRNPEGFSPQYKDEAVAKVERLLAEEAMGGPRDDELRLHYVTILLVAGYPERAAQQAESELREVAHRRNSEEYVNVEWHTGLIYNLACARAQMGDEEGCRQLLIEHETLGTLDSNHLLDDPDMASVRETAWFQELVERHREETERRNPRTQVTFPGPMVVTDRIIEGDRFTLTIAPVGPGYVIHHTSPEERQEDR